MVNRHEWPNFTFCPTKIGLSMERMGKLTLQNLWNTFWCYLFHYYKRQVVHWFPRSSSVRKASWCRVFRKWEICRNFIVFTLKSIFENDIKQKFQCSKFVTDMYGGLTDSPCLEKECIYIGFVDPRFPVTQLLMIGL